MWRCLICRFDVDLDDVTLRFKGDRVVCIRCFARETQTEKPMPAAVRRDAQQTADQA